MAYERSLWWIIVAGIVIIGIIFGNLCQSIAQKKGYDSRPAFWIGFFLNLIGLIYHVGLPLSDQKYEQRERSRFESLSELMKECVQLPEREDKPTAQEKTVDAPLEYKTAPKKADLESGVAHRIPDGGFGEILQCKCSLCGARQNMNRKSCFSCGKKFED